MSLLINGKLVELPAGIDPQLFAESLLQLLQQLPPSYETSEQTLRLDSLPQERTVGVLEKGYVIIGQGCAKAFAGTENITHCIGISIFDPDRKLLAVAHLDIGCSGASLAKIFTDFKDAKNLEIRLFGGLAENEIKDYESQNKDSKKLVISILEFLVASSHQSQCSINIRSADIFNKLESYKDAKRGVNKLVPTGFAIHCETGNVVLLKELSGLGEAHIYTPYSIKIDDYGIHSGVLKSGRVAVQSHTSLGYKGDELAKRYDFRSDPPFFEVREKLPRVFIDYVVKEFSQVDRFPICDEFTENTFLRHVGQFFDRKSFNRQDLLTLLLREVAYQFFKQRDGESFAPQPDILESHQAYINIITEMNIFAWYHAEIHRQIIQYIQQKSDFDLKGISRAELLALLQGCHSDFHLADELSKAMSNENENLISSLVSCTTFQAMQVAVNKWRIDKLADRLNVLCTTLANSVRGKTGKVVLDKIVAYFKAKFDSLPQDRINLNFLDARVKRTNEMIHEASRLLCNKILEPDMIEREEIQSSYCLCSSVPVIVSVPAALNIESCIDALVTAWLDAYVRLQPAGIAATTTLSLGPR